MFDIYLFYTTSLKQIDRFWGFMNKEYFQRETEGQARDLAYKTDLTDGQMLDLIVVTRM